MAKCEALIQPAVDFPAVTPLNDVAFWLCRLAAPRPDQTARHVMSCDQNTGNSRVIQGRWRAIAQRMPLSAAKTRDQKRWTVATSIDTNNSKEIWLPWQPVNIRVTVTGADSRS